LNSYEVVLLDLIDNVKVADVEPTINPTNPNPIKLRPYKVSPKQSKDIKEEIQKFLKHRLIATSHLPWAFSVLLYKKKKVNGECAWIIDEYTMSQLKIHSFYPS